MRFRSLLLAATLMIGALAHAHDYKLGELIIDHPYARPTVPNQPGGAAYLSIENNGNTPDKLVAATSPVAKKVEIHTISMEGNIMRMREVPGVEVKPKTTVTMKPGESYHLMLQGLKEPLLLGAKFPMKLTFEKAGDIEVSVWVEDKPNKNVEIGTPHH